MNKNNSICKGISVYTLKMERSALSMLYSKQIDICCQEGTIERLCVHARQRETTDITAEKENIKIYLLWQLRLEVDGRI